MKHLRISPPPLKFLHRGAAACIAALVTLLPLSMTTAHAATSHDIGEIGSVTGITLTETDGTTPIQHTVDGKTVNGTTVGRNGFAIQMNISGRINQRIGEGDTVTIPMSTQDGSHYRNDNVNAVVNMATDVNDAQGRKLFTATFAKVAGARIVLTATKQAASLVNSTFTVRPQFTLWFDTTSRDTALATSSAWTVAGHPVSFPNKNYQNEKDSKTDLAIGPQSSDIGGFHVYASSDIGGTINKLLAGETPPVSVTADRIIVATITPLDGPISEVSSEGIKGQWRLGYDDNSLGTVEWESFTWFASPEVKVPDVSKINTVQAASRTLKPNQHAAFKQANGVWIYAMNLGPIKDRSLPAWDMRDQITQKGYDKARAMGLSPQVKFDWTKVTFNVQSVKQSARIDWSNSWGQTGSLTMSNSLTSNDASGKPLGWVAYDGNGATSGNVEGDSGIAGTSKKVKDNAYVRPGYRFTGWNTSADGGFGGVPYQPEQDVVMPQTGVTLYAQWTPAPAALPQTGGNDGVRRIVFTVGGALVAAVTVGGLAAVRRRKTR